MGRKIAISITLKAEVVEKIDEIAKRSERSKSSVIEELLQMSLQRLTEPFYEARLPLEKRVIIVEKSIRAILDWLKKHDKEGFNAVARAYVENQEEAST